jgi:hypothetical protein
MDEEIDTNNGQGLKVRDAIELINKGQEEKNYIMLPGLFWDGCEYNKVLELEKIKTKPKKSTPMQILIQ